MCTHTYNSDHVISSCTPLPVKPLSDKTTVDLFELFKCEIDLESQSFLLVDFHLFMGESLCFHLMRFIFTI